MESSNPCCTSCPVYVGIRKLLLSKCHSSVVITRYGKPIAALVSYEDLVQLQRIRKARQTGGLAHLADDWEDSEDFVNILDEVVQERR